MTDHPYPYPSGATPLLYGELAEWWPLLSSPDDYVEEAAFFLRLMKESVEGPASSLLELGSGGGNNASHLKAHFDHVTLVDLAPGMIEVSRALNPDCEHLVGDMRSIRLGRAFDCVMIHDAICYMTTLDDLRRAVDTAAAHCRAGGVVLLAPDFVKETFVPGTEKGGHDGPEQALRYLSWEWDPDPSDTTVVTHYAYMVRERDGSVRVFHDQHVEGIFPERDWLATLAAAGLEPRVVSFPHPDVEHDWKLFVGVRQGVS